jgi:hypothetical protein
MSQSREARLASRLSRGEDFPPELWTPERHPQYARRGEIARLDRSALATVDQRIAAGHYEAVKLGDLVLIKVASVFKHIESAPLHRPRLNQRSPRSVPAVAPRKRGRPPKRPRPDGTGA